MSTPFFANEANLRSLKRLATYLSDTRARPEGELDIAPRLHQIVQVMVANANRFDELCSSNIEFIGGHFFAEADSLTRGDSSAEDKLPSLFTSAYRFLCELELSQEGELTFELRQIKAFVEDNFDAFPVLHRRQLVYAHYLMPASIARQLLHHPNVAEARQFRELLASASKLKDDWKREHDERTKSVDAMRAQLERYSTAFNFVGLVDGFHELSDRKKTEKRMTFRGLVGLGLLAVAPVAIEVLFVALRPEVVAGHGAVLLYTLPALVTLEVILVYFFRVVLSHFRSLNAQLLQLDLRAALCKFIQSYAEYAAPIKKQDSAALEKFESLIFSGLVANADELPSTFDGTEQISKLVRSVRGG